MLHRTLPKLTAELAHTHIHAPHSPTLMPQTDGLVWVVDSADRARLADCKAELHGLLQQEVRAICVPNERCTVREGMGRVRFRCACNTSTSTSLCPSLPQKLAGASLLIFANKQDLAGALSCDQIAEALDLKSEAFAKRHWHIVPCSAVTGSGLVAGMDWMVEDVGQRIFMSD